MNVPYSSLEHRILVRAPTARDAVTASTVLRRAGFDAHAFTSLSALVEEMSHGAGAIVLAEEALADPAADAMQRALAEQPAWSDLPVLVLARQGVHSHAVGIAVHTSANVTVIERPVRMASFLSSVRSAMRARARQYDLRALLQGLREADQRKTEFLATLAHELRNPLAPLLTALSLLVRKRPEPAEAARHYAMMRRQIDHMVRLVDDLMEVSRITRGKIELDIGAVDLQRVLHDAAELSRPQIDKAQHVFSAQMPLDALVLQGDAVRLTQVFSNLLNNAAKYTPSGGHIDLVLRREPGQAVVEVRDDGIGIARPMLGSIFDMFVQANDTAKSAQGGLGIGLTLVRSLVELHGGTVAVDSKGLGLGAQFTVRLPVHAPSSGLPAPQAAARALPHVAAVALVVDDNQDAADTLGELLDTMGFAVTVVYSGQAALDALASIQPALAILDIGMPGMDGFKLAQRIRQNAANTDMVLVALTGWGQPRDREKSAAAGFDHHLVKPLDMDKLMPILEAMQPT
jgi:signal transduction histidine kinase/BarA-like signal transduction histidine kinase